MSSHFIWHWAWDAYKDQEVIRLIKCNNNNVGTFYVEQNISQFEWGFLFIERFFLIQFNGFLKNKVQCRDCKICIYHINDTFCVYSA